MHQFKIACVAGLLIAAAALAEPAKEAPEKVEARTRFEAFASADGKLLVKEFYELTAPPAKYGRSEAAVIEVRDTGSGESMVAMRIQYKGSDRYARERSSILDEDEIQSLFAALQYIRQNQKKLISTAKTYTEVTYTSRGGFQAGFYVQPKDKSTGFYMSIGHDSVFLNSLDDLAITVDEAVKKVQEIRS